MKNEIKPVPKEISAQVYRARHLKGLKGWGPCWL
jgi:hypothetical protein